ncbi:MAG: hypothetical protein RQ753_04710 [Desulfurivibrionaceae bacterium]|nr:hypothetical protein [Desulfobulbales bacterium]MDT8334977.1 hypothetical protein [Desulfurivibrionaceae bacterium]
MKTLRIFHPPLLAILFLTGCLATLQPERADNGNLAFAPQEFKTADFVQETEKLRQVIRDPAGPGAGKAEAHRRLAILYLIPANPDRDPQKAVEELGRFLELAPRRLDRAEAADWLTALNYEARLEGLDNENRELIARAALVEKKNRQLLTANRQLAIEKEELTAINTMQEETIGKIKQLDLALEQKKRRLLR